jgi:hypothetical protein
MKQHPTCAFVLLSAVSCGGGVHDEGASVDTVSEAVAASGSNAVYVSSTMKSSWYPGERNKVSVTMQNTGTASPTNDWTAIAPKFALNTQDSEWTWVNTPVTSTVATGDSYTFSFLVIAPTALGAHTFMAQMRSFGFGDFGDMVSIPITVSTSASREWGCTYVAGSSTLPTTLTPGENRKVTVTVQNAGTGTWVDGFYLTSEDTPRNLWAQSSSAVRGSVIPGASVSWNFTIRAPSTTGTVHFMREMSDSGVSGFGLFQASNFCVDVPIDVTNNPAQAATVGSQNFPTTMTPGQTATVTVSMNNTGTQTWAADGTYGLWTENTKGNLWGATYTPVKVATPMGSAATFTFQVTAPSTGGAYEQKWGMRKLSGTDAGLFGAVIDVPVTVGNAGNSQDCKGLLAGNPSLTNGVYQIDVDGSGPTAPFDVYCDMTNGGWTQVNDQDVSVDGGYLTIPTWLAGVTNTAPNGGQWGVLNHLSAFVRTTGDYELRLTYGQDESKYATWVQTGDPLSATRGTLSSITMNPPNQIGCGTFNGLGSDDGNAALDGNTGGCWWFAVGSQSSFGSGIPAYEQSDSGQLVTDRVRLYVRR